MDRLVAVMPMVCTVVLTGCSDSAPKPTSQPDIVLHYHSSEPGVMQSTLNLAPTWQRMSAVTQLADGSSLHENVRLDSRGRVLDGKLSVAAADSSKSREVVLDAARGSIEVTTPTFHTYWQVPHDLPWAWTSLLSDSKSGAPLATPLAAMVAQRAAAADAAVRWLDIAAFQNHSLMGDQLVIPEDGTVTVLLGDDWAELTNGVAIRVHLDGLDTDLEGEEPELLSATLAARECTQQCKLNRGC